MSRTRSRWNAAENEHLRREWGKRSAAEIAGHLGRTEGAVRSHAQRIGLTKRSRRAGGSDSASTGPKRFKSFAELQKQLAHDLGKVIPARIRRAAEQTADLGRLAAYGRAPVAFGELRDGIVDEPIPGGARIISTAPHSAAVENGSRPHMPPIGPILAWVRLRGAQGLDAGANAIGHAGRVASAIAAHGNGVSTPVDAAERVAWAIARAIAKHGTKPTHFMRQTVPDVERILDSFIKSHLNDPL